MPTRPRKRERLFGVVGRDARAARWRSDPRERIAAHRVGLGLHARAIVVGHAAHAVVGRRSSRRAGRRTSSAALDVRDLAALRVERDHRHALAIAVERQLAHHRVRDRPSIRLRAAAFGGEREQRALGRIADDLPALRLVVDARGCALLQSAAVAKR